MADNKLLLKRNSDEDFLAEDDPLAELARIVGFDPAPGAKASAPAQRREPAFDLEDELLKELEVYAQPSAPGPTPPVAPVLDAAAEPAAGAAPAIEIEPEASDVRLDPVLDREPVILEAVETFADASEGRIYERPASHPVFDLEDEILREFAAFDARHVSREEDRPVEAEVIRQDPPERAAVPSELHEAPDARSMTAAPISREHGRDIYESFRADDLDDAITNALSPEPADAEAAPASSDWPVAAPDERTIHHAADEIPVQSPENSYSPDVDADLDQQAANSHIGQDVHRLFHSAEAQTSTQGDHVDPSIEQISGLSTEELVAQDVVDAIPMTEDADSPVDGVQPVPSHDTAAVQASASSQQADNHALDALLAEVERYPVSDTAGRWGVQSKPVAAEEVARAAPAVTPYSAETAAPAQPVSAFSSPVEDDSESFFDEGNFDIDLGAIELDLSDLSEGKIDASPELLAELADEPVVQPEPVIRQAASRSADVDYSSLPFDPSQIAQEDEPFEPIGEMDVPEVPAVHEEEKPAPHTEYDIDLDAEMAQLFAAATAPSGTARPGPSGEAPIDVAGAQNRAQPASLDLDEFERALEEDFRRSFAENRSGSHPDRVALAPVYAAPEQGRNRRGIFLLASAAVAIVLFGGAGVYAYMSGDAKILTSSEPKVILADTDPVKVVPDDPGGKQVPNQNKAVYDRVAGDTTDKTKQQSLLTSNEEPVDVVQRTLMPEALPMDDDSMAAATPTGDTIDPRLLPDDEEKDRVTTTSKVVSGVSPRKVKTMVVRSDGTLVEREVTEEDLKQQAANDAELMKIAQKAARDAATANDSQSDDIAKAIASVPERLAPNDETTAKPVENLEARTVKIEDVKPVVPAETAAADVDAVDPVKIEDEQPAVVDKPTVTAVTPVEKADAKSAESAVEQKPAEVATEVKPVETAVADKPVERSIDVGTQSAVVDQDAMAKAADVDVAVDQAEDAPVRKVKTTKIAPVPEVRPVDQPVTVVGTVTDQGTVRSDAKPQQVALADTTTQAVVPAGGYVIQIASLPSEAEAQTSYSRLSAKFAGVIGGRGVDIRKAEIKNKGTYYRVRIPAGSKQEAQALCAEYKKAGGSCLVSK